MEGETTIDPLTHWMVSKGLLDYIPDMIGELKLLLKAGRDANKVNTEHKDIDMKKLVDEMSKFEVTMNSLFENRRLLDNTHKMACREIENN